MNLKTDWVLRIDPKVEKAFKKIPQKDTKRIITAIEQLPENPFGGDIQKMKGEQNVWRRRVGEYRFFYELISAESVIHVFLVERRTTTTY